MFSLFLRLDHEPKSLLGIFVWSSRCRYKVDYQMTQVPITIGSPSPRFSCCELKREWNMDQFDEPYIFVDKQRVLTAKMRFTYGI